MIAHNKPSLGKKEQKAVKCVIKSRMLAYQGGKQVQALEQALGDFLGLPSNQIVMVSSGSVALFLALKILAHKEMVVTLPSYTCHSLKQACELNQLKIKLEDVTAQTVWAQANKTAADIQIEPYTFGFARKTPKNTSFLIADISQALGARIDNQALGLQADIGICSFSATKMMTTGGQGGMLFSKNKALIEEVRQFIDFDRPNIQTGFNFNLTEMQAAFGLEQVKRLPYFIQKRQEIFNIYQDYQLPLWDCSDKNAQSVRFRAIIKTDSAKRIQDTLFKKGIKTIIPITEDELLANMPNAYTLTQTRLSLPIYPCLSLKKAKKVAQTVRDLL